MKSIVAGLLSTVMVFGAVRLPAQETTATTAQDAAKGVPATQEVEATGTGTTENEAFKQAVVDAVRQVVGTLVSAENVVKNDRVVKDEVLTLSNGFVEKVLKQEKNQQADGSWLVRLKCVIRKGQLYRNLQKANVPTIKFDGVSLFADVVSQLDHEKSSAEMIRNAMKKISSSLITVTMLEEKPRTDIDDRNEEWVTLNFAWAASVDVDAFFTDCVPALDAAFSGVALAKAQGFIWVKETKEYGIVFQSPEWNAEFDLAAAIPVAKEKRKWKLRIYQIDRRILELAEKGYDPLENLFVVVAHFRDSAGMPLLEVALTDLKYNFFPRDKSRFIQNYKNGSDAVWPMPMIKYDFENCVRRERNQADSFRANFSTDDGGPKSRWIEWIERIEGPRPPATPVEDWWVKYYGATLRKFESGVRVPTKILKEIVSVDLTVEEVKRRVVR
jgi:hypothetical protein